MVCDIYTKLILATDNLAFSPIKTRAKSKQSKGLCECVGEKHTPSTSKHLTKQSTQVKAKHLTKTVESPGKKMATPEEIKELISTSNDQLREAVMSALEKAPPAVAHSETNIRLEPYGGKSGEDVERFIRKFENKMNCKAKIPSPEAQAAELACHLIGPAETWYCSLPPEQIKDVESLKVALRKRFLSDGLKWQWRQQLAGKRQASSEDIEDYIQSIGHLCLLLGLSDNQKLHYFVMGLNDTIKKDVLLKSPETYEQAEAYARLNASVNSTIRTNAAENTQDTEKATLLRLLEKLMPASASTQTSQKPKVNAIDSTEISGLKKEIREFKDEVRAALKNLNQQQNVGPQRMQNYGSQNYRNQNYVDSNFSRARRNQQFYINNFGSRGGPICFNCNREGHIARNCIDRLTMPDYENTFSESPENPPNQDTIPPHQNKYPHYQDRSYQVRSTQQHSPRISALKVSRGLQKARKSTLKPSFQINNLHVVNKETVVSTELIDCEPEQQVHDLEDYTLEIKEVNYHVPQTYSVENVTCTENPMEPIFKVSKMTASDSKTEKQIANAAECTISSDNNGDCDNLVDLKKTRACDRKLETTNTIQNYHKDKVTSSSVSEINESNTKTGFYKMFVTVLLCILLSLLGVNGFAYHQTTFRKQDKISPNFNVFWIAISLSYINFVNLLREIHNVILSNLTQMFYLLGFVWKCKPGFHSCLTMFVAFMHVHYERLPQKGMLSYIVFSLAISSVVFFLIACSYLHRHKCPILLPPLQTLSS